MQILAVLDFYGPLKTLMAGWDMRLRCFEVETFLKYAFKQPKVSLSELAV